MWPIQAGFLLLLYIQHSCPPWRCVRLLNFLHNRSNWSSPSFSSITFKNFPGISDLLSETPNFQHRTRLCTKCCNLPVFFPLNLSQIYCRKESSFSWKLLLPLQSQIHPASNVTMLPKYLQYSTFSYCFWPIMTLTRDGFSKFLLP